MGREPEQKRKRRTSSPRIFLGKIGSLVEGYFRNITHEWDRAIEIYRILFGLFPDNVDYGLRLAQVRTSAGKGQDALQTLEALRRLPGPASSDPRIDLQEAATAHSLGDYTRTLNAYAKAMAKARVLDAKLMEANALMGECGASQDLGESERAQGLCEESRRLFAQTGDSHGLAEVLNMIATARDDQGDLIGAKKMYQRTLEVFRETGDKRGMATALNNIGSVLESFSDPDGAKKKFEEALEYDREIGDMISIARDLNNVATVLEGEGNIIRARAMYEEALAIDRVIGNQDRAAVRLINIGEILYYEGDLDGAKQRANEAVTIVRATGDKSLLAAALSGRGDVLVQENDFSRARKDYQEAMNILNDLGQKLTLALNQLHLADLSIEEGHLAEAEVLLHKAIKEFELEKALDNEILGGTVLARALLMEGRAENAQKEIDAVRKTRLGAKSDRTVLFELAIVTALVQAEQGETAEATKNLEATLVDARKLGFVGFQFEARLALGEIEMTSGRADAGRAFLAAVEKDATSKGFLLIAQKAHHAAGVGS